jgi:two-component system, LytTR family, response regulator
MDLRVMIVEDEPKALERLQGLCDDEPEIDIVAKAQTAGEAIEALMRLSPSILFLDVELRGSTAFDVLRAVPADSWPVIVFTTAHTEYALAAFESAAIDYLVKPYSDERFRTALARARAHVRLLAQSDTHISIKAGWFDLLSHLKGRCEPNLRLCAERQQRLFFLNPQDVESAVAEHNCVALTSKGEIYTVRLTLRQLEVKLEATSFMRIHKSLMINLDHVRHMERAARGSFLITLRSGAKVRSSPIYRSRILQRFSNTP